MRKVLAIVVIILILSPQFAFGTDYYYAPTATGAGTGADCNNAYSFGDATHGWNLAAMQATSGNGNTLHICPAFNNTYNFTSGATAWQAATSGSASFPVTLKFETGAILQAPYFGDNPFSSLPGGVSCSGYSYVTIDGGTNGIIQNTANGTGLANDHASSGVSAYNCPHFTIQGHLTVQHIYVHLPSDTTSNGESTQAVGISDSDNFSVTGATISDGDFALGIGYNSANSITSGLIANNTIDHGCHLLQIGDGTYGASASGIVVRDNVIGPHNAEWNDQASGGPYCHQNAVFMQAFNCNPNDGTGVSCSTLSGLQFNGNTIQSDMCSQTGGAQNPNCTGYVTYGEGVSTTQFINNTVQDTVSTNGWEAFVVLRAENGATENGNVFYNNTFDANNAGGVGCTCNIYLADHSGTAGGQSGFIAKNNAAINFPNTLYQANESTLAAIFSGGIDNNSYYNNTGNYGLDTSTYTTLSLWQGQGFDASVVTTNPLFTNYIPAVSSPLVGAGANLTSLGITPLDSDKAGLSRPATGGWTMGAYNANPPAPNPVVAPAAPALSSVPSSSPANPISYSWTQTFTFPLQWANPTIKWTGSVGKTLAFSCSCVQSTSICSCGVN